MNPIPSEEAVVLVSRLANLESLSLSSLYILLIGNVCDQQLIGFIV